MAASSSYSSLGGIVWIGAGSLLAGVVLMLATRLTRPQYFTTRTPPPLSPPAPAAAAPHDLPSPGPPE